MTPAAYKEIVVECMKQAMCESGGASTFVSASRHNQGLSAAQRMLHVWSADSGLHHLPQNFRIHSMNASTLWRFWVKGDASECVQPYRLLKAHMLPPGTQLQSQKQQLSRMLYVGNWLQAHAGASLVQLRAATVQELGEIFNRAWLELVRAYPDAKETHAVASLYTFMHAS